MFRICRNLVCYVRRGWILGRVGRASVSAGKASMKLNDAGSGSDFLGEFDAVIYSWLITIVNIVPPKLRICSVAHFYVS
jgi:hypothetical protein